MAAEAPPPQPPPPLSSTGIPPPLMCAPQLSVTASCGRRPTRGPGLCFLSPSLPPRFPHTAASDLQQRKSDGVTPRLQKSTFPLGIQCPDSFLRPRRLCRPLCSQPSPAPSAPASSPSLPPSGASNASLVSLTPGLTSASQAPLSPHQKGLPAGPTPVTSYTCKVLINGARYVLFYTCLHVTGECCFRISTPQYCSHRRGFLRFVG